MTKEELKQEAEESLDKWSDPDMGCCEGYCYSEVADFMFRFAEPREKRIAEFEKENAELKKACDETQELLDKQIEATYKLDKENEELKLFVSSMLYEINALWDISEMNEDVRKHAERIDSEVEK